MHIYTACTYTLPTELHGFMLVGFHGSCDDRKGKDCRTD